MSITAHEIRNSTFTSALTEVEELTLTNKGILDLGSITEAPNLRIVNLSFNKLVDIRGLASLQHLCSLNVSHNHITSLKGLAPLTSLTQLNASYNKVTSLAPISGLTGLKDLFIQHNALADPPCLQPLSGLTCLQRLCVAPNALCKALDSYSGGARLLLLRLCPSLQLLDAAPYTEQERSSLASGDAAEAAQQLEAFKPSTPGGVGALSSLTLSSLLSSPLLQRSSSGSGPASGSLPRGHESGLPSAPGRIRSRAPLTTNRIGSGRTRSASPGPSRTLLGSPSDPTCDTHSEPSEVFDPSEAAERDSLASTSSSRASGGSTGRRAASQGRRGSGAFLPRIKTIPEGSSFLAVLDMLPKLDPAKLPPSYSPGEGVVKKAPPPRPPPDTQTVEYECRYPRHTPSRAVTVKRDGSLVSYWPNGDLAVTVDVDYQVASGTGSSVYRMFAVYRTGGNVAISFETAAGGFLQYPNGSIAMLVNSDGGGTVYKPSGETITKWTNTGDGDNTGNEDVTTSSSGSAFVDLQLDGAYGVRYIHRGRQLHVYMACEGFKYMFVCGSNAPGATWDPGQGVLGLNDGLPPPKFLTQLAQEGPAAGAGRTTLVRKDSPSLDSVGAGTKEINISAITNTLKALEDSLTAWAMDRNAK